jgi:poly-gamma-glutamate synthesis protein (capsule biosynthesis protein)
MKFTAAGDMIIQKPIYPGYEGFGALADFIKRGDARFFNLETTLNHVGETCANQFSGGTYIRTDPEILENIKPYGFNMTTANNNHILDFSYGGLETTLKALNASGLVHAGIGMNLDEAAAPRYLETAAGRVALIAVNTSFKPAAMAGRQSPLFPGRPGMNGLRIESYVELPQADIDYIKQIAKETNINAEKEITRAEGYHPPLADNEAEFGELKFRTGKERRHVSHVHPADMARVKKAIFEAQLQADYIMISVHSHQLSGSEKETPSDFLRDFAHECIDAGAHAILGHGPHLLRPIEIYKDCPIFYSLGDFILQLYNVPVAPEDFYEQNGLTSAATVHELLKKRSKDFTIGLMADKRMFISAIPYWETDGTKLTKLMLLPIEMDMDGNKSRQGLPYISKDPMIGQYLAKMCEPYGTKITQNEDGTLSCTW